MSDEAPGTLTARINEGTDPTFETDNFPIENPIWVVAFGADGTAVSMFREPRSYDWALSVLRRIEEVFMRQAGWFDQLDLGDGDD